MYTNFPRFKGVKSILMTFILFNAVYALLYPQYFLYYLFKKICIEDLFYVPGSFVGAEGMKATGVESPVELKV